MKKASYLILTILIIASCAYSSQRPDVVDRSIAQKAQSVTFATVVDIDKVVIAGDADVIGGEEFLSYKSRRGTSALEGFDTHQKLWLGTLATHSKDAGSALLTDGAMRWNRKRKQNRES